MVSQQHTVTRSTMGCIQTANDPTLHHRRAYQPHRSSLLQNQIESSKQRQPQRPEVYDDDDDDDFMMRIVHGSCQGVFQGDGGSLCQLPTCHLPDQLDLLMHCRQPLSFLSFFRATDGDVDRDSAPALPAGAYMMPTGCEYCGAKETDQCDSRTCRRPNLYFQKKRPPFCRPDSRCWDVASDHAIPPPPPPPRSPSSPFEGSWVTGLFRGNKHGHVSPPTQR